MDRLARPLSSTLQTLALAAQGLRTLSACQLGSAAVAALVFGGLLGAATVLIPNSFFVREIPPEWWNYPVWIVTSVFAGLLVGTYVRDKPGADDPGLQDDPGSRRSSRAGVAGAFLAWFAVGCPVCNKFALLALGYSGAITWFAPVQPLLAVVGLVLITVALVVRLRGRVACVLPSSRRAVAVG